jgi:hypothetical protein
MAGIYHNLIVSTISKLNASFKKPVRPYVSFLINGHRLSALYDTGANICCMSSETFRGLFPLRQRPEKINRMSSVSTASGNKLEVEGIYPISLEIKKRKFTYNFYISNNLNKDIILGINFFQEHGLGYDLTS